MEKMKKTLIVSLVCVACAYGVKTFAATPSDAQIAAILKTANDAEVDAAKLEKSKGSNESVKAFASEMIAEHSQNNKDAKNLLKQEKITPKTSADSKAIKDEAKNKMADLKATSGESFDKTYIDQQVDMHQKVLAALTDQFIPNAQNAELKAFLETTKNHVQHHLEMAQKLQTTLSK